MKRLRWLALLMMCTILGIAVFQLYWLRENYIREEKSLTIKSNATFRDVIQELQVFNLKLEDIPDGKENSNMVKVVVSSGRTNKPDLDFIPPEGKKISTVDVFKENVRDSLTGDTTIRKGMIISLNKVLVSKRLDSGKFTQELKTEDRDNFYRVLYRVDSLQDSLKISVINSKFKAGLAGQNINVPFQVHRLDSSKREPADNEVTIGFAKPVTYRLELLNTFSYLLKRISLPILLSILLFGITLISFILLYKSLLTQHRLAAIKNEFISNITHELKTPIATVGVAIEALKNFNAINDPTRTKEYLDILTE